MATGFDKNLFANPGFASAFMCIKCKLVCTDIRELSCNKGHLCCATCWNNMSIKQCPNCLNCKDMIDIKRSRFVEGQQFKLEMKCPNNACKWKGTFGLLSIHLSKQCLFRKELCEHCKKSFIYREFSIHRETCSYLLVSCPFSCNKNKKWLRMKISQHLKTECPKYILKCDYFKLGCKEKLQRQKMINHLKFECKYRIVSCPFAQYGCNITPINMHYYQLSNHLKQFEVKHLTLKLVHLCDQIQNIQQNMDQKFNEQSKQIEFLQRKLSFHTSQKTAKNINSLSNDCNGLLVFCGSKKGKDSRQNSVEFINIKNKTKYTLFDATSSINDINRIYNHQYLHLSQHVHSFKNYNQVIQVNEEKKKEENNLHNLWDVSGNGICTGYNIELSYIQPYLLNSSFGDNTSGIDHIFKFKQIDFWRKEKVSMIFRCGGWLSKTGEKLSRVDGCCLETNDWFQLPYMNEISYGCGVIYSHIHGLIVVGGKNDSNHSLNTIQRLKASHYHNLQLQEREESGTLKWESLPPMFARRYCAGICLWEDMKSRNYNESELLIVSGGSNKVDGDLKSCSIYDFNRSEWHKISDMNIKRSFSTLIHWKYRDKCIAVGGLSDIAARSVEEYDLIKDQWYKLPSLNKSHRKQPNVWIDNSLLYNSYNGILCVCGGDLGSIEILDVRDSSNKWQMKGNLSSFFQSDIYKNKVFRRIVCC